jgi:hypothetical protein
VPGIVVPDCGLGIVELDCALGVVVDGVAVVVCAEAAVTNAAPSAKATTAVIVYFIGITPRDGGRFNSRTTDGLLAFPHFLLLDKVSSQSQPPA